MRNKQEKSVLKTLVPFLLAANLILPILIVTSLSFRTATAQSYNFPGQSTLPLNYKVMVEYRKLNVFSGIISMNASFSSEAVVNLNALGHYEGNGSGFYKEVRKGNECHVDHRFLLEGNATMHVRITPDNKELNVQFF